MIGDLVYAAVDTKVVKATNGGAYSDLAGGGTAATYPLCIVGYDTSTPKIFMASAAAVGVRRYGACRAVWLHQWLSTTARMMDCSGAKRT